MLRQEIRSNQNEGNISNKIHSLGFDTLLKINSLFEGKNCIFAPQKRVQLSKKSWMATDIANLPITDSDPVKFDPRPDQEIR